MWFQLLCVHYLDYVLLLLVGTRFFCSQLVAPIRDENGDICLYILNFEDLSSTDQDEDSSPTEAIPLLLSRCKLNFDFFFNFIWDCNYRSYDL